MKSIDIYLLWAPMASFSCSIWCSQMTLICIFLFMRLSSAGDPFKFLNFEVSYIDASPLGVSQQVCFFRSLIVLYLRCPFLGSRLAGQVFNVLCSISWTLVSDLWDIVMLKFSTLSLMLTSVMISVCGNMMIPLSLGSLELLFFAVAWILSFLSYI